MALAAYRWQGNVFCEEHVVPLLTEIEPWKEWLDDGHTPTGDAEADLSSIAEYFGIDRTNPEQVDRRRLPARTAGSGSFCGKCLHWFE